MKKKSPSSGLMGSTKKSKRWHLGLVGFLLAWVPNAMGSPELDRQFLLESIGFIKPVDNLDSLFSETISHAYKDYFSKQSRFVVNDLSQAESVLTGSKIPYSKLIDDPEVLRQLMRSTHTEGLIRTKIKKQGSKYTFTLDWLHGPQMEVIHTTKFTIDDFAPGASLDAHEFHSVLEENLDKLVSKVPFRGHVTGRDEGVVTINLGSKSNLRRNDTLVIGTLEEVRIHPLLKTILGWRLLPTGKLRVEQVEEGMAFCRVVEEEPGRPISRYQKIIQIESSPVDAEPVARNAEQEPRFDNRPPSLGWIGGSLLAGNYSRQFSSVGGSSFTGGGLALGAKAEGEIWLTKKWFTDLEFGYASWNYSQKNAITGVDTAASQNGGVSGSVFNYKLSVGHSFLLTDSFMGPKAWVKLGYRSSSYSLPVSRGTGSELTGPISMNSLFVGVGGDLPIEQRWGGIVDFNFRLFTSVSQTWLNETTNGASEVQFFLGGYYRLTPRLKLRGGLEFLASSADFSAGSSLSQKTVTIAPGLLYYF